MSFDVVGSKFNSASDSVKKWLHLKRPQLFDNVLVVIGALK